MVIVFIMGRGAGALYDLHGSFDFNTYRRQASRDIYGYVAVARVFQNRGNMSFLQQHVGTCQRHYLRSCPGSALT